MKGELSGFTPRQIKRVLKGVKFELNPLAKELAAPDLRTIHLPDVVDGVLTWDAFRLTMEEATGIRFPERVDCEVIEEKPLALPAPAPGEEKKG